MANLDKAAAGINWPLWIGVLLEPIGISAIGWVIVYAMASTAAPPDMPLPFSQYLCLFGGPAAVLIGLGLIVVGIVRKIRGGKVAV